MNFIKRKGESLAEAVIALFVISMGVAAGFMLVLNSLRTGISIRDRVEAINLAREGIEAVRVLRDSNWIKYGGDKRSYWNCMDTETCANKIEAGKKYVADFDENLEWRLYDAGSRELDLEDGVPLACLETEDEDCFFALDFKHCENSEVGYYTNSKESDVKLWNCEDGVAWAVDEPKFFRQLTFEYKDDPYTTDDNNILEVTVLVQWFDQNDVVKTIEMTTYLTDFLGRNNNSEG